MNNLSNLNEDYLNEGIILEPVKLKGNPHEIGLQYGERCEKEIKMSLSNWYLFGAMSLTRGFREGNPSLLRMMPKFLTYRRKKTHLQAIAKKYEPFFIERCPETVDMMQGIADGAKVDYEDILYLNAFPDVIEGCSIWGACGSSTVDGTPLLCMNTDEMTRVAKSQVVLYIESEDGFSTLGMHYAGIISPINGMNSAGLSVASMMLILHKPEKQLVKAPSFLVMQQILNQCTTVEQAIELYQEFNGVNYGAAIFLADTSKIARIENSPEIWDSRSIEEGVEFCVMRPHLEKIKVFEATHDIAPSMTMNAEPRTKRMEEILPQFKGQFDVDVMKEIAKDHGSEASEGKGICQHGGMASTIGSFIVQPAEKRVWFCKGSPCSNPFHEYSF